MHLDVLMSENLKFSVLSPFLANRLEARFLLAVFTLKSTEEVATMKLVRKKQKQNKKSFWCSIYRGKIDKNGNRDSYEIMDMSFLTGLPGVTAAHYPAVPASAQSKAGEKYPPHIQNLSLAAELVTRLILRSRWFLKHCSI